MYVKSNLWCWANKGYKVTEAGFPPIKLMDMTCMRRGTFLATVGIHSLWRTHKLVTVFSRHYSYHHQDDQ
jgi:hypothetical protein